MWKFGSLRHESESSLSWQCIILLLKCFKDGWNQDFFFGNLILFRWASIIATTLVIRWLALPLMVNQLKATSKFTVSSCTCFLLTWISRCYFLLYWQMLALLRCLNIEYCLLNHSMSTCRGPCLTRHIRVNYSPYCLHNNWANYF